MELFIIYLLKLLIFIIEWVNLPKLIVDGLNSNSGLITALATVVLVIITGWYARVTDKLLKATDRPEIVVSLHIDRLADHSAIYVKYICVKNVGTGVARGMNFGGDLDFKTVDGIQLNQIYFLEKGIDALPPGKERCHPVTPERGPASEPDVESYDPVVITVSYKDTVGDDHDREFTLDFNDKTLPN